MITEGVGTMRKGAEISYDYQTDIFSAKFPDGREFKLNGYEALTLAEMITTIYTNKGFAIRQEITDGRDQRIIEVHTGGKPLAEGEFLCHENFRKFADGSYYRQLTQAGGVK